MDNLDNNQIAPATSKRVNLSAVIAAIIVTVILSFGVMYFWPVKNSSQTTETPVNVNNEVKPVEEDQSAKIEQLEDELFFAKFENFAKDSEINYYVQDPNNKNIIYYIQTTSAQEIFAYNRNQDQGYQPYRNLNTTGFWKLLYSEKLPSDSEFRFAGVLSNKVVFYSTLSDDSPHPCMQPVLVGQYVLQSVDPTLSNITKQPYIASQQDIQAARAKEQQCQTELGI